jgi:NADH-quinone oxidoreductase subunit L
LFSINPFFFEQSWLYGGLSGTTHPADIGIYHNLVPAGVNILSLLVIWFAYSIYNGRSANPFPQKGLLYNLSAGEWYFDAIYSKLIIKPVIVLSRAAFWWDRRVIDGFINILARMSIGLSKLSAWVDHYIVDGFIRMLIAIVRATSNFARRFQGGKVQYYIYSMLVVILALFILKNLF